MARFLILLALVWLGWLAFRTLRRKTRARVSTHSGPHRMHGRRMVRCAQCDLHIPDDDAIYHDATAFCCQAHKRLYLEHHRDE